MKGGQANDFISAFSYQSVAVIFKGEKYFSDGFAKLPQNTPVLSIIGNATSFLLIILSKYAKINQNTVVTLKATYRIREREK